LAILILVFVSWAFALVMPADTPAMTLAIARALTSDAKSIYETSDHLGLLQSFFVFSEVRHSRML